MRVSMLRYPLFAGVLLMLAAAGWAALQRAGWALPEIRPTLVGMHGPLMIGGVFGALISLERAVAIAALMRSPRHWAFLAPFFSAAGGVVLLLVGAEPAAKLLLLAGSACLGAVYLRTITVRRYWSLYTVMMGLGAVLWLVGNLAWAAGQPIYVAIHPWLGFIVLTIVGERIELSRVLRHSRRTEQLLMAAAAVYIGGVLLALIDLGLGVRLSGLGALLLALWLIRFDLARRNARQTGLARYIALCLLIGYVWLGVSGILAIAFGAVYAGLQYDAFLHAVAAGFVLSMVFGHAPLIFPALTGRHIAYSSLFYLPLILLHAAVLLREISDLAGAFDGRMWASLLNAAAVVIFFGVVAAGALRSMRGEPG
ncbi:MAG: hypothetical protein L6Q98_14030 [Anaerolineae bacterium]|nr:hypothetical protein [Anaerolineae bacterium]NUQ03339.1 hypothetical protein [Anaerolineae bacterium]